jgi:hypothetical protein
MPYKYYVLFYSSTYTVLLIQTKSFEEPDLQDSQATPPKISGGLAAITQKENTDEKKSMRDYLRSPSDYFPMIRRGHVAEEEKKEVGVMGWGIEVTSRKEREELLR